MDEGTEGGLLHGGGYERQVFRGGGLPYMFQAGRIFTGLTVVEFLLADEGARLLLLRPCPESDPAPVPAPAGSDGASVRSRPGRRGSLRGKRLSQIERASAKVALAPRGAQLRSPGGSRQGWRRYRHPRHPRHPSTHTPTHHPTCTQPVWAPVPSTKLIESPSACHETQPSSLRRP